jgi:hypothetical protein
MQNLRRKRRSPAIKFIAYTDLFIGRIQLSQCLAGLQQFLPTAYSPIVLSNVFDACRGSCALHSYSLTCAIRELSAERRFYILCLCGGGGAAVKVDLEHRDRAPRAQNGSLSFKTRPAAQRTRQLQILRRLLSRRRCLHTLVQKNQTSQLRCPE